MFSEKAARELAEVAQSAALRKDTDTVSVQRHNPFIKEGKVDIDAYLEFVMGFNEFISHEPKQFELIIDKDMRL